MGNCLGNSKVKEIEHALSTYTPEPHNNPAITLNLEQQLTLNDEKLAIQSVESTSRSNCQNSSKEMSLYLKSIANFSALSFENSSNPIWKTARKPEITLFIDKERVMFPVFDKERALEDYGRCDSSLLKCLKLAELKYQNVNIDHLMQALNYPNIIESNEGIFERVESIYGQCNDIEEFKDIELKSVKVTDERLEERDFLIIWQTLHFWQLVEIYPFLVLFFKVGEAQGHCLQREFNGVWKDSFSCELNGEILKENEVVTLQTLVSVGEQLNAEATQAMRQEANE